MLIVMHGLLEGAFSGEPGSLLIAGTGSMIFGKDKNNQIHRVGGFGKLIGDEGSGQYTWQTWIKPSR